MNAHESLAAMTAHQRRMESENVALRRELAAARARMRHAERLLETFQVQQGHCRNAECGTAVERFARLQEGMNQ